MTKVDPHKEPKGLGNWQQQQKEKQQQQQQRFQREGTRMLHKEMQKQQQQQPHWILKLHGIGCKNGVGAK